MYLCISNLCSNTYDTCLYKSNLYIIRDICIFTSDIHINAQYVFIHIRCMHQNVLYICMLYIYMHLIFVLSYCFQKGSNFTILRNLVFISESSALDYRTILPTCLYIVQAMFYCWQTRPTNNLDTRRSNLWMRFFTALCRRKKYCGNKYWCEKQYIHICMHLSIERERKRLISFVECFVAGTIKNIKIC